MRRSLPCHSEDAAAIVPEAGAGGKLRREGGAKVAASSASAGWAALSRRACSRAITISWSSLGIPREGGGPRSDGRQGCRLDRGRTKCSLNVQTTFLPLPNHFFHSAAHPALLGGKPSWRCQVKQETNRSSKPAVPLRSSHLAAPWPRSIN